MMIVAAILVSGLFCGAPEVDAALRCWPAEKREAQLEFEKSLNGIPAAAKLRAWHELLGSEPHVAGTPGDARVIDKLVEAFKAMGLQVQRHEFHALLARPIEAKLQIIEPAGRVIDLPLKEDDLPDDPFDADPALTIGWNAYSGSGDVTAEIVYANHGTKEDFAKLRELGVDVAGKIVIARYGGNFRGYKAKFAEEAGAAGLIIYTDPADAGYVKGLPYPEGGWANDSCIQRGSLVTLPYPGDPLTPGMEATEKAPRLKVDEVALPRIPEQPIGYKAAGAIISRMRGASAQAAGASWQGGLPCAYRLSGGPELRVRLLIRQERAITKTANVIATLAGSKFPDEKIIIGCHHDAWAFGAADPLAGTILLMESARSFSESARSGRPPARTIIFAAWGAEEFGIVGSTEWCEANAADLSRSAVAYINLDAAAMGTNFGSGASPSLERLIEDALRVVPQARGSIGQSAFDAWNKKAVKDPATTNRTPDGDEDDDGARGSIGDLGGGSDHVGFLCHLGVPACSLGGGGSEGTSYHSNYDDLAWYRKVVGEDYEPAIMLTRILNVIVARMGEAPILPLDPARYATDAREHLSELAKRAAAAKLALDTTALAAAIDRFQGAADAMQQHLDQAVQSGRLGEPSMRRVNRLLMSMDRAWLSEAGLPGRPWFRNLYAASDPDSGYAAWVLPGLRWAVEKNDESEIRRMMGMYADVFDRLEDVAREIDGVVTDVDGP